MHLTLVGFMDDVVAHLDPDAIFSSSPCLSNELADPIAQYAIVIASPVVFIVVLTLVYLFGKVVLKGIFPKAGLINVIGEVLVEFYISITLAIFSPFDCFSHPSGDKSVQDYPSVLCGEGDHGAMVGLSVFGILAYPVMAMVVSASATWYFPRALVKNEIHHMVRCSFLFERWRPECYWFCNVSISRNFAIAVLPSVMPEEDLDVTILLMMIVLVLALVAVVWFKPRRSDVQNCLDCFICLVQITVLSFGVTSVHGKPVRYSLSAGCVALIGCVVCMVVSLIAYRAFQIVSHADGYSIYICHHSGSGGTGCRVLHGLFTKNVEMKVFYDIDVLGTLNSLSAQFAAVKRSVNLLVAFGSETLCRPWCIGAIVCAFRQGTPVHRVVFTNETDTVWPSEDPIKKVGPDRTSVQVAAQKSYQSKVFNIDTIALRGFGLPQEAVIPAIQPLTRVAPILMNFRVLTELSDRLEELCAQMNVMFPLDSLNYLFSCSMDGLAQFKDPSGNPGAVPPSLILSNHRDGESIAGSRLFSSILANLKGPKQTWIEDQDLTAPDYATFIGNCKPANVLMLCSPGAFESAPLLARLGLLVKCQPSVDMLPVVIGATFDFGESLGTMIQNILSLKLGINPSERLLELAGGKVSYQEICAAVEYSLTFPISFINVPKITLKTLQDTLRDLLAMIRIAGPMRAEGGEAAAVQDAPEPEKKEPQNQQPSNPPIPNSADAITEV